nr:immunoglobulin heavy chain junction region [Macaca mulatta]
CARDTWGYSFFDYW